MRSQDRQKRELCRLCGREWFCRREWPIGLPIKTLSAQRLAALLPIAISGTDALQQCPLFRVEAAEAHVV
jgi:hypothetical protein